MRPLPGEAYAIHLWALESGVSLAWGTPRNTSVFFFIVSTFYLDSDVLD